MASSAEKDDRECPPARCGIGRRAALELGLCLALAPGLALAQDDAARLRPQEGDLLIKVGGADRKPLTPDDLPVGGKQIFAWPVDPAGDTVRSGSRLNKVLLLRLDEAGFDPMTKDRAAAGVVAYSAVCTHTGCDVIGWQEDAERLACPCHISQFGPKEAAKVVSGPASSPLPALPLRISDGKLVVVKPFTGRAGFQQV